MECLWGEWRCTASYTEAALKLGETIAHLPPEVRFRDLEQNNKGILDAKEKFVEVDSELQ